MIRLTLSKDEILLLQKHIHSPVELIRFKAMVVLARYKEVPLSSLTVVFHKKQRTLTRWIKDYSQEGMSSIFSGMIGNQNASKLTRGQKAEVKRTLSQPPSEYGLPVEFWDTPKLKEYLSAVFGVEYESDRSYHYLLKFSNLSFKYPDKLSPRRDEGLIQTRIAEVREEIKPFLTSPDWIVLASDETRVQLEAEIRRAWLVKGQRTIVKTERSDEHQNYLGFLDLRYGTCQVFEIDRGNQIETIKVLRKLVNQYPDKRICVVWDNARWHKGKLLRYNLSKDKSLERLHLISFPPYAPEHNPIEHVWQYAKSKISNRHEYPFPEIKQDFLASITNRTFDYKI